MALDRLVEVCLGVRLEKDPEIRLCVWSASTLTPKQLAHAVLDAEYSLRVFFYLLPLDNLTLRLGRDDAIAGVATSGIASWCDVHSQISKITTTLESILQFGSQIQNDPTNCTKGIPKSIKELLKFTSGPKGVLLGVP